MTGPAAPSGSHRPVAQQTRAPTRRGNPQKRPPSHSKGLGSERNPRCGNLLFQSDDDGTGALGSDSLLTYESRRTCTAGPHTRQGSQRLRPPLPPTEQ
jgi:hypothetical protein